MLVATLFADIPVTDDNWYKNQWGFFNQRETADVFVGERPCRIHKINDTFINCTVFYDKIGSVKDVRVLTYGKGWSHTSVQYEFTLEISSITPETGSIVGGTLVNMTGAGFLPYQNVGGKVSSTSYHIYFGYDDSYHKGLPTVGKKPEAWTNGWNRGYKCKIETVANTWITCRMPMMGPDGSEHYREEEGEALRKQQPLILKLLRSTPPSPPRIKNALN